MNESTIRMTSSTTDSIGTPVVSIWMASLAIASGDVDPLGAVMRGVEAAPHLVALIFCPADESGQGVFEVVFRGTPDPEAPSSDDDQLARNVSPFSVEPGKFTYRLVRGELEFSEYRQVFAHCRIDRGPWLVVPFTLLPPG